ncbi:Crp/Fnr family transcriptional regulator [Marivirga lumbricoides]|uniref:Crp/Fnr family transcriptional regulator n=1 Tax=Marivirga lumbricoides TaxID=1046115 RepID=A0A2T4DB81_9BACT|nr:Crp/Fnr family transcriptional regulator [Marivirga lumbricoides]
MKKGDFYLKAGLQCNKLSFVKSGLVRIYSQSENKEVTQWISDKSSFITDLSSWVFGKPSRWTMQALTDVTLFTIYKSDYQQLEEKVRDWHKLEKMFIAKCFAVMEDRIFSHLSMTAEDRYQFFYENNRELFNQVPLQYIASLLGMTPETFSRIRKKQLSRV